MTRMPDLRALALGALALGACHDSSGGGGPPAPRLESVGISALWLTGSHDLWVLAVSESQEGGTDLNGDGDALDVVAHVYRLSDGVLSNLGLALSLGPQPLVAVGDVLVGVVVDETAQGDTDLNGDGDADDLVVHVYDDNSGATTSTGLATWALAPVVGAGHVAFAVSEAAQGGTDLDSSGGASGSVLHVYDARTGLVRNAERNVTGEIVFHDHAFAFTTDEPSSGADLNGDGDTVDQHVFEMFDLVLGGVEQVPLAVRGRPLAVNADDWFLLADEAEEGQDLNGDLDLADAVFHEVHPHQGTRQSLGLSSLATLGSLASGTLVALTVQEVDGVDRNGDGDLTDTLVVLYDQMTGALHEGRAILPGAPLAFLGRELAFLASEADERLDLNADGDELDQVLQVLDGDTGALVDVGLDAYTLSTGAGRLLFGRSEPLAGEDWNGDGDTDDVVLFTRDPATGASAGTGIAGTGSPAAVNDRFVLLVADELAEGTDLDGDGDVDGLVYVLFEPASDTSTPLAAAVVDAGAGLSEERGVLLLAESDRGADLNGDGDLLDAVLHVLVLP